MRSFLCVALVGLAILVGGAANPAQWDSPVVSCRSDAGTDVGFFAGPTITMKMNDHSGNGDIVYTLTPLIPSKFDPADYFQNHSTQKVRGDAILPGGAASSLTLFYEDGRPYIQWASGHRFRVSCSDSSGKPIADGPSNSSSSENYCDRPFAARLEEQFHASCDKISIPLDYTGTINLSNLELGSIDLKENMFSGLGLGPIDLSYNKITKISPFVLSYILGHHKALNLSHNQITELPPGCYNANLDMSYNQITDAVLTKFSFCQGPLASFAFLGNLNTRPPRIEYYEGHPPYSTIDLGGNPLTLAASDELRARSLYLVNCTGAVSVGPEDLPDSASLELDGCHNLTLVAPDPWFGGIKPYLNTVKLRNVSLADFKPRFLSYLAIKSKLEISGDTEANLSYLNANAIRQGMLDVNDLTLSGLPETSALDILSSEKDMPLKHLAQLHLQSAFKNENLSSQLWMNLPSLDWLNLEGVDLSRVDVEGLLPFAQRGHIFLTYSYTKDGKGRIRTKLRASQLARIQQMFGDRFRTDNGVVSPDVLEVIPD